MLVLLAVIDAVKRLNERRAVAGIVLLKLSMMSGGRWQVQPGKVLKE